MSDFPPIARESRAPQSMEWGEVVKTLHYLHNLITVRSQYPAGHPAIARADELAEVNLTNVLSQMPELVVALVDDEFVIADRPLPDLRARLGGLAAAMTGHDIECMIFQQGLNRAECTLLGDALTAAPDPADAKRTREQTQSKLAHVLLRFTEIRARDDARGHGADGEYLVPVVGNLLADVVRTLAAGTNLDREAVREVARRVVSRCAARLFTLQQRCHVDGAEDEAGHATNVAMCTAAMALDAGYPEATCIDVTAAALLHDIGHLFLPREIRGVPEPLLDDRMKVAFRHHPFLGARALLAAGAPPLWVATALEHHRGVDGGGYPSLGTKDPPHELVRLVSFANFFDRRRTLLNGVVDEPDEALRRGTALKGRYFDAATVRRFSRALGVFPPGTTVELSDRQAAIVVRTSLGDPLRPEVRLLTGPNSGKRVDLRALNAIERRHELSIVRAIPPPLMLCLDASIPAAVVPASVVPEAVVPASVVPEAVLPPPPPQVALASIAPKVSLSPAAASSSPPARALIDGAVPRISVRYSSIGYSEIPAAETERIDLRAEEIRIPSLPTFTPQAPPRVVEALSLDTVVVLAVSPKELTSLPIDHRAGFILSFVDGQSSLETILDCSGLSADAFLAIVSDLTSRGVLRPR